MRYNDSVDLEDKQVNKYIYIYIIIYNLIQSIIQYNVYIYTYIYHIIIQWEQPVMPHHDEPVDFKVPVVCPIGDTRPGKRKNSLRTGSHGP